MTRVDGAVPGAGARACRRARGGLGLIGTSVGLALRAHGVTCSPPGQDPAAAALAQDLGAGSSRTPPDEPGLVVVCTPPAAIGSVLRLYQSLSPGDVY